MKSKILVVGASGKVGSEIVRLLLEKGLSVRAATSKRKQAHSSPEIETVQMDLVTGEGIKNAFEGVDRAFFLSPPGFADQYRILSPLIQEAKRRGLKKVVLMTAMGANAVETSPFRRTEIELEKSGISYNIIRPNWFMDNFNTFWIQGILEQGKILLPAGKAKVSFIDSRDISAVAAKLLTNDDFNNQAFDLTGPESLDHDQVASMISKITGKTIRYQEIEPSALKQGLVTAGLNAEYADFLLMIFGALREGYSAPLTENVQKLLGRAPTSLKKYAEDHKRSWL